MAIRTGRLKRRSTPVQARQGQIVRSVAVAAVSAGLAALLLWWAVYAGWAQDTRKPLEALATTVWTEISSRTAGLIVDDATADDAAPTGALVDAATLAGSGDATLPPSVSRYPSEAPAAVEGTPLLARETSSVRSAPQQDSSSAPAHANAGGNGPNSPQFAMAPEPAPQPTVEAAPVATATPTLTPGPTVEATPVATATGTLTPEPTPEPTPVATAKPTIIELAVSDHASRADARPLAGADLTDDAYIFLRASQVVTSVSFFLDEAPDSSPWRTEYYVPYDFEGGSESAANAWDIDAVSAGAHIITAVVVIDGTTQTTSAEFDVVRPDVPEPGPASELVASTPIVIDGESDVVIEGLHITSTSGDCIVVKNAARVTIRNSEIGPCGGRGVWLWNSTSVKVLDNYIHPEHPVSGCCDTGDGVLVQRGSDTLIQGNVIAYSETNVELMSTANVTVRGNFLLNPMGPFPRGQQVQLGSLGSYGPTTGVVIDRNYTIASRSSAYKFPAVQEDAINIGAAANVSVTGNYIVGGHSASGCGIIADHSATQVTIDGNFLNETANCGIGITTGHHMRVTNNRILNTVSIGGSSAIYVWDIYNLNACDDVYVAGNIAYSANSGYVVDLGGCTNLNVESHTSGGEAYDLLSPFGTKFPPPPVPPVPYHTRVDSPWS